MEIRYFTVSLALFNPAMMTDVVLSQSNKFTVFLVLCLRIIQITVKITLFHYFAVLSDYYPAVRTGSSNTRLFSWSIVFLGGGHLPQTAGFHSAKQIRVANFRST